MSKHPSILRNRVPTVAVCPRNRARLVLAVVVIAAAMGMVQRAVADDFVWKGAPSIYNSWSDQTHWMNVTPGGGTDPDGIPDGNDTAIFNSNAITSGGTALNLSIGTSATLSVSPGEVTVDSGTLNNRHILTFFGSTNSGESLSINGAVTLNGGGEVQLVNNQSQIRLQTLGSTLTNADNLIHGGNNGSISVPITNQSLIRADNGVLNISAPIDNSGGAIQIFTGATLALSSTITRGTLDRKS